MKFRSTLALASVSLLALSVPAFAQNAPADDAAAKVDDEIVVVGTSLRKVAPAGAQEFTVSAATIQAKSVQSTDALLATIPQLSSFGNLQTVNSGGTQLTVNRTNLRNLPQGIGGSSPTLVLMDGHRFIGVGTKQSYPDPDVIPPALIERVEILTDGGSAIYGSDAVGGVINFVTKRNFDGIQAGVRQSLGDGYRATDANLAVGKTWDTGSVYVAYNFSYHNAVYGASRDFIKNIDWTTGLGTSKNCSPANVTVAGATYAVVGGNSLVLGNQNLCDRSKVATFYPKETRHSVMAGFRQELSDTLEFGIKGFFSDRKNVGDVGPLRGDASGVASTNPNYISIGGGSTATQAVAFDFGPVVGGREIVATKLWSYGITPTLTWKIGSDWQMKALFNYGQSKTTANDPGVNATALGAAITAGTINPYKIASSNSAAITQVLDWVGYGIGKSSLTNAKATIDGPLFSLPGGELRVALGGEYLHEKYEGTTLTDTNQNVLAAPLSKASRNVESAFVEASIPVIAPDMNWPIHSLNLSASVRYDHYSDFGSNWAPNFGISLKPVKWINLRARWNKSFQAPSVVNLAQASSPTVGVNPGFIANFVPLLKNTTPGAPAFNGGPIVSVQGTASPLQPQRARDYNLGVDISPPFVEGLDLHLTYFNIDYKGSIGSPPLGFGVFYEVPTFQNLFIMLPSIAQLQQFLTDHGAPAAAIANAVASVNAQGGAAYVAADVRQRNLGVTKLNGFDISFDYQHPVSFGTIYANFNSTLVNSSLTANDGFNFNPDDAGLNSSAFNHTLTVGATVGDGFRGQVTWNHRGGYRINPAVQLGQTTVGAFNSFDLYAQYDWKQGSLPPITLSLGVNNIFNKAPPIFRGADAAGNGGYANGSPLGRVFQLGASVKF